MTSGQELNSKTNFENFVKALSALGYMDWVVHERLFNANFNLDYQKFQQTLERVNNLRRLDVDKNTDDKHWILYCLSGNLEVIQYAIRNEKITYLTEDRFGQNPLDLAFLSGSVPVIRCVMNELKITSVRLRTSPILMAAMSGSVETIKFAHEELKATIDEVDVYNVNALHLAAASGSVEAVRYVLYLAHKSGIDLYTLDSHGKGLNTYIWYSKNRELIIKELQRPIEEIVKEFEGQPVHQEEKTIAPSSSASLAPTTLADAPAPVIVDEEKRQEQLKRQILQLLSDLNFRQADIDELSEKGFIKYDTHFLEALGKYSIYSTSVNHLIPFNWVLCCLTGNPQALKYAIEHKGVYKNMIDQNGGTALHLSALVGSVENMQICLNDLGLNLGTTDYYGLNALHLASSSDSSEAVEFVRVRAHQLSNSDLNVKDKNGLDAFDHVGGVSPWGDSIKASLSKPIDQLTQEWNEKEAAKKAQELKAEPLVKPVPAPSSQTTVVLSRPKLTIQLPDPDSNPENIITTPVPEKNVEPEKEKEKVKEKEIKREPLRPAAQQPVAAPQSSYSGNRRLRIGVLLSITLLSILMIVGFANSWNPLGWGCFATCGFLGLSLGIYEGWKKEAGRHAASAPVAGSTGLIAEHTGGKDGLKLSEQLEKGAKGVEVRVDTQNTVQPQQAPRQEPVVEDVRKFSCK